MSEGFDAYHRWLGIPPTDRPLNHYRLLGLQLFESDVEVIRDAAERQMAHVRQYQLGPRAELTQKVLNELAAAKGCLLEPDKKAAYDAQLRSQKAAKRPLLRAVPLEPAAAETPKPPPLPPAGVVPPPMPPPAARRAVPRSAAPAIAIVAGVLAVSAIAFWAARRGGEVAQAPEAQIAARSTAPLPRPATDTEQQSQARPAEPIQASQPSQPEEPAETAGAKPEEPTKPAPVPTPEASKPREPPAPGPTPEQPRPAEPAPVATPHDGKPTGLPPLPAKPDQTRPSQPAAPSSPEVSPTATAGAEKPAMPPLDPSDEVGRRVQDAFKLLESGASPAAYEMLKDVVKLDREDIRAEFLLGLMEALVRSQFDDALKRFDHCRDKQPEDPAVLNNFALVAVRLRQYAPAVRAWQRALAAGPATREIVQNVGRMSWLVDKAFKLDARTQDMLLEIVAEAAGGGQLAHDSGIGWLYASTPLEGKPVPQMNGKAYEDVCCPICYGTGWVACPNRYCRGGRVSTRVKGNEFQAPGGGPRIRSDQIVFVPDPRCQGRGMVGCAACGGNPGTPSPQFIRRGTGIQPGLTPPPGIARPPDAPGQPSPHP